MSIEVIEKEGIRYAEIIWTGTEARQSTFFSPADSAFQFGILARPAGFFETPHVHKKIPRTVDDLQQMFVVQRGVVAVGFYDGTGRMFHEAVLKQGDAINLVHGAHSIRVIEDMQCISVKQGPFFGAENDKIDIRVTE